MKPTTHRRRKTMAPIVYHQVAADIAIDDHTASDGSAAVMMAETEEHQAGGQFAVDSNNFGHTRDENDVGGVLSMGGAAAVMPRSGETTSNAFTQQPRSSFFMDECINNHHLDEDAATADLKSLALMTSFDFDALEDIDLMTSPPSNEQFQEEPQQYTTTATDTDIAIISADEELARQLQAEEDESARLQREAIIFRKAQNARSTREYKPPRKKLKKSWLDKLIGEPFPQEMRRNYATRSDSQQNSTRSSKHVTLPTPSYYDCPTCTSISHFSNLLLHDSCRYSHDKHKTQIPLWCLTAY